MLVMAPNAAAAALLPGSAWRRSFDREANVRICREAGAPNWSMNVTSAYLNC